MKRFLLLVMVCSTFGFYNAKACSCFGPHTFCQTLNPPYAEPQWWIPNAIIMAVKLNDHEYAADMKVIRSFSGTLQNEEIIRVWGDCGLLCRNYVNGLANGDTVIWGVQHCDLSGNGSCGTSFEEVQDYQLSVCGIYWLNFNNGIVSGPLTIENATENVTLTEFEELVNGCLATSVEEAIDLAALSVRSADGGPWLSLTKQQRVELSVVDVVGRSYLSRSWDGSPLQLFGLPVGTYMVQVNSADRRWVRKVAVGL